MFMTRKVAICGGTRYIPESISDIMVIAFALVGTVVSAFFGILGPVIALATGCSAFVLGFFASSGDKVAGAMGESVNKLSKVASLRDTAASFRDSVYKFFLSSSNRWQTSADHKRNVFRRMLCKNLMSLCQCCPIHHLFCWVCRWLRNSQRSFKMGLRTR